MSENDHYLYINVSNLDKLVGKLLQHNQIYAPVKFNDRSYLEEISLKNLDKMDLTGFRAVEPFKMFLFKLIEKVSKYFGADEMTHEKNMVFLGMRACDIEALEVLDKVLAEGEFTDPFYTASRSRIFVIGADCTSCGDTCFCTLVKGQPYPSKYFDINLTPINSGYIVTTGSEKGKKLVADNPDLFESVQKFQAEEMKYNRKNVIAMLDERNSKFFFRMELSDAHKRNVENTVWKKLTKDCVECSSCNFICPTCTCFVLLDENGGNSSNRYKVWDACLKASYAKVAGGANPRGKLYERLQNRYDCKFNHSFDRIKRYTCVGCGRCIDGCAGNIDMRKVFMELVKQAPLTAKLE